jgi:hypothetical protein
MRVMRRGLLVTTTCLAASVFLSAGVSHAKKSSSTVKVKVEADLHPCGAVLPATSPCVTGGTPPELGAEGEAKHEKESKGGVSKKDEFKGTVKIPVSLTSALGIFDATAAGVADIRLILSKAGGDYAECKLAFYKIEAEDDDDDDAAAVMAEYKVNVLIKKGAVVAKKGGCTDMAGAGPIVPDAQLDDVATATKVVNPLDRTLDVDFLQGTFVKD